MSTKLTLNINENVLEEAKLYAEIKNTSLSELVENYFRLLAKSSSKTIKISPLVESLTGIIPEGNVDYKRERQLGTLEGKMSVIFAEDFKMSDEELINL